MVLDVGRFPEKGEGRLAQDQGRELASARRPEIEAGKPYRRNPYPT